jgi:hypothetical protein
VAHYLRDQAWAASTNAKYNAHWKQWTSWCTEHGFPALLPADQRLATDQLALYASQLWCLGSNRSHIGNSHGTILGKLAAVRSFHKRHDRTVSELPSFQLVMQGIKRLSTSNFQRLPADITMLRWICSRVNWNAAHERCIWGIIVLAYFFLLRRSEIAFIGAAGHWFMLRRCDIIFWSSSSKTCAPADAQCVSICLRGAKNDQYGAGSERFMFESGDSHVCPVRAAQTLCADFDSNFTDKNGPIACSAGGQIKSDIISTWIKAAAAGCGRDPARYSFHSLRVGGASALLNGKEDHLRIKLLGRWKSDCFQEYTRIGPNATKGMSSKMLDSL